jgi:hypothetical protein
MRIARLRMAFWSMLRGWDGMLALRADERLTRAAADYIPYLSAEFMERFGKQRTD